MIVYKCDKVCYQVYIQEWGCLCFDSNDKFILYNPLLCFYNKGFILSFDWVTTFRIKWCINLQNINE